MQKGIAYITLFYCIFLGSFSFGQDIATKYKIKSYPLNTLLQKHFQASGGITEINSLKSLKIRGVTEQDSAKYSFLLYKRKPNRIRVDMKTSDGTISQGYDGRTAWIQFPKKNAGKAVKLEREMAAQIKREARFVSPLLNYVDIGARLENLGLQEDNGVPVYNIEVTFVDRSKMNIFINAINFLHVKSSFQPGENGALISTSYSDYRVVGKRLRFAYSIENYVNGELVSKTKIDQVSINFGLLSKYFEMPED